MEKNKSSLLILNKTRKYTVCLNIKYQVNSLNIQGSHTIIIHFHKRTTVDIRKTPK